MLRLILVTIVLVLNGCANSEDKNDSVTNSKGGNCGTDVVRDYNTMVHNCRMAKTVSSCDSSVTSFLEKYPGINCKAERSDPNSVNKQVVQITENKIRELLSSSEGGSSDEPPSSTSPIRYKNGEACSSGVVIDYNVNVVESCRSASSGTSLEARVYEKCRDGISRFISRYPGLYCKYTTSNNTINYMRESELLALKKDMDELASQLKSHSK